MLGSSQAQDPETNLEEPRPPLFTKMKDAAGCDARLLSALRIESVLMTDFVARKQLMQSKMIFQPSKMVKLDFTHKIPGKVNVCKGVGDCFKPHRCMFVLQNEKNQTVCWKCLASSESMTAVKKGIDLFCKQNPETVVVIWCDNCCNTREKLQQMFPGAVVKLDIFHWDKRWDPLLFDSKSEEASMFRGLTRRATFHVPTAEHELAKQRVRKKLQDKGKLPAGSNPTHRQIMNDCRSAVPAPEELRKSVMSVIRCCMMSDTGIEIRKANRDPADTSELPKPFFKPLNADRRKLLANQMEHVVRGCLSDPPGMDLHQKNPETGKATCCRGTNSIENDNLCLDQLTGKAIGIAKADRLITTFFELGNDRKMTSRLGRQADWSDVFTNRTEELALINSMCLSAGFEEDELPFKVSNPPQLDETAAPELGFDMTVPVSSAEVIGDVVATATAQLEAEEPTGRSDIDCDEEEPGENLLLNVPAGQNNLPNANAEEDVTTEDVALAEFLDEIDLAGDPPAATEQRLSALSTEMFKPETTMESFVRLTNQQQWVPFNHSKTLAKSAEDVEEEIWI